jgi:hypothetical protein
MMLALYVIAGVIGYWLAGIVIARLCWWTWSFTEFDATDSDGVSGLLVIIIFWPFVGFFALTLKLFAAMMRRDS